ncbi:hypothetical protein [Streptomyces sp. NPDC002520]
MYTPLWGPGPRTAIHTSGPFTEVVVKDGRVSAVGGEITDTLVPEGGLIVVGQGVAAARLAAARIGDEVSVSFEPRSDSPAALRMALGSNAVLVKDGTAVDFPPGASVLVGLTGFDADGFDAPVAAGDVAVGHDAAVVDVKAEPDGRVTVTGGADAHGKASIVTATVDGVTARLPVTVGLADVPLAEFEPGAENWTALASRGTALVDLVAADDRRAQSPAITRCV